MRRLVTYASEPNSRVPAYLLVPKDVLKDKRKAPAALCLHGTDNTVGHGTVVGLGKNANRNYASELADRGYVCLAPNYPLLAKYHPDVKKLGWESGTLKAVWDNMRGLDYLESLGVTAIELMPVADFPGRWGWGYDGVLPFAPDSSYGRPEALKALVDACHERGLAVFLDVVYNHFGPEGNYLHHYAPAFFHPHRRTPWGDAINFDGVGSHAVRAFVIHNALYWLEEYHLDGLRLDSLHGRHVGVARLDGAGASGRRGAGSGSGRPPRA